MVIAHPVRLSRRRLLSLAAAGAAGIALGAGPNLEEAGATQPDLYLPAPYLHQGATGDQSSSNCGPATVAMAINYSQVAFPTVADVRTTLGSGGPTDINHWAWLLDVYGVPWYSTWSQWDMDEALKEGHVLLVAAMMADFATAPDFESAYTENVGWAGRFDSFASGHALLIAGSANGGTNYLVHDPNVFPGDGTCFYADGTPKGAYRRYSWWEMWGTIARYSQGRALAVVPPTPLAG